jgi:hypothetical protein
MASLVRPMASTPSGLGAGSGAVATPSTTCRAAKPSSCALCSATSSTRATTCVVPAALVVGVSTIVSARRLQPQSRRILSHHHLRRHAVDLEHEHAARGAVAVAELGIQRSLAASARAGPEPSEKNFLPPVSSLLAARLQPAYWLARQASTGCELRTSSQVGQPSAAPLRTDAAEAAQADLADQQAGRDAAFGRDAGVDDARAGRVLASLSRAARRRRPQPLDPGRDMRIQAQRAAAAAGWRDGRSCRRLQGSLSAVASRRRESGGHGSASWPRPTTLHSGSPARSACRHGAGRSAPGQRDLRRRGIECTARGA